jgi:Fe-S-cluster containining protein
MVGRTVDHGDQTGAAVPCFRCGVCCVRWQPLLGPAELRRLAGDLGVTVRTFKRRYARRYPLRRGWWQLRATERGCVFLDITDGISGCTIHAVRPQVCRDWTAGLDRRECLHGLREFPGPPLLTLERLLPMASDRAEFVAAVAGGAAEPEGRKPPA